MSFTKDLIVLYKSLSINVSISEALFSYICMVRYISLPWYIPQYTESIVIIQISNLSFRWKYRFRGPLNQKSGFQKRFVRSWPFFILKKSAYIACTGNGSNSFDKMLVKSRSRCPLRLGIRPFLSPRRLRSIVQSK